jgi:uncharacterized membrane protein YbhN (UPF0104 family)
LRSFDAAEVVWTLITLVALVVHLLVLWEATSDVRMMKSLGHKGRRWIVAMSTFRREAIRTVVQLLLCAVGVMALLTPPRATESPKNMAFVVIFLAVSVLLLGNSILDFRERDRLRSYGRE